jgi:hypothetical protein
MEKVERNGKLYAMILRARFEADGVTFFTSRDNPLQLGILQHKKGVEIAPHIHKTSLKTVESIQEVLHIEYGKVETEFYDNNGEKIGSSTLCSGDTILLIAGGHGFKILEDSKILEIKQGPYYGVDEDKEYLKGNLES